MIFGGGSGRLAASVFVVIGAVLLFFALRSGLATRAFVLAAVRAEGTVTKLNAGGSHPQISFTTDAKVEISYPQGGLIFGYRPGDKVQVLYRTADPSGTATINAVGALWFPALLMSVLGMAFLVMGAIAWPR